MEIHALKWAGLLIMAGLVSACTSYDRFEARSTEPAWVRNLNEPPPNRVAAIDQPENKH